MFFIASFLYIVISIIFVTFVVYKGNLPQLKGYVGEQKIRKLLGSLGEDVKVYNDLYVPKVDGEMTQIDHVLVSAHGVYRDCGTCF